MISPTRDIPQPHPPARRRLHRHLYFWVLLAIVAGALIGHFFPGLGIALKFLGDAFIALVKMIIAPIIFLTLVTGIAGMRSFARPVASRSRPLPISSSSRRLRSSSE